MNQDKNIGDRFKKLLKDYKSPIDPDTFFDAIEDDLPTPEKKRRFGLLWLGCGTLIGFLPLLFCIYTLVNHDQSQNQFTPLKPIAQKQSSAQIEADLIPKMNEPIIQKTTSNISEHLEKNIDTKNKNVDNANAIASDKTILSQIYSTPSMSINKDKRRDEKGPILTNSTKKIQPLESNKNSSTNPINPIEYLKLKPILGLSSIKENAFLIKDSIRILSRRTTNSNKIEFSLFASSVQPFKNSKYSGNAYNSWFNDYQNGQTLLMGLSAGIELNYFLNKSTFASLALNYLGHQEKYLFNTSIQNSYFDENLAKTIYVNRDGEVIDTDYGVEVTTQSDSTFSLITNVNILGVSLGIGKQLRVSDRFHMEGILHFTPYVLQSIKGNTIGPDSTLSKINNFELDDGFGSLNNHNLNIQASMSIKYRVIENLDLGFRMSYRHHLKDFSSFKALSQRRSYLDFGLILTRRF